MKRTDLIRKLEEAQVASWFAMGGITTGIETPRRVPLNPCPATARSTSFWQSTS